MKNGVYTFQEIGRHPLLQPQAIDGILSYFPQIEQSKPLSSVMPMVEVDKEKVEWDIEHSPRGGMTPLVSRTSESPVHDEQYSRGRVEFEPAEFREKVKIGRKDFVNIRRIGTVNEKREAESFLTRKFSSVLNRIATRIEWSRRQVLFNGNVQAEDQYGNNFTVNYSHPSYLEENLTGTSAWNDYGNSDPVRDLQGWVRHFRQSTSFQPTRILFGADVLYHVMENSEFQTMMQNRNWDPNEESVREHLQSMAGIPSIEVIDDQVNVRTQLTQDLASGASDAAGLNLERTRLLQSGMDLRIMKHGKNTQQTELLRVDSVSGNTVVTTDTADRPDNSNAFSAGDPVGWSRYIMPKDEICILGSIQGPIDNQGVEEMPDMQFIDQWADVCSTQSYYNDFNEPETGVFQKTIDKVEDGDPPRLEKVAGIRFLPRTHYLDAWMTANVLD